jgi:hypothetical protein
MCTQKFQSDSASNKPLINRIFQCLSCNFMKTVTWEWDFEKRYENIKGIVLQDLIGVKSGINPWAVI